MNLPKRFKKVYIEISNVCNLQCPFCPEVVRGKRFMEPDLFRSVARTVAPLTDAVCFHLMGEPLLHPDFAAYADFCNALGLPIHLTTNGLLLDEKRRGTLLGPAFQQINFSLQSFEANFPGQDDSTYLQRIFDFTQQALCQRPDLYINYRLWNAGVPGASISNNRLFARIRQHLQADFTPVTDLRWRKGTHIKGRLYLHQDSRFEWPDPHQPVRSTRGFCHGLSSHLGILADGTVVPCCLDKEGVIALGNCRSTPLEEIIQGPRARAMREGFEQGILIEDLCQKCTFIARFDNKIKRQPARPRLSGPGQEHRLSSTPLP